MKKGSLTACIFARGGSKGVARKNIREVAGKPLIAYSIESALASEVISSVLVSTDDTEIAEVAASFGAEVLMRPSKLAQDQTPEIMAWRHVLEEKHDLFSQQGVFISLPATSPFRAPSDIDSAVRKFFSADNDIVFTITPSSASPYLSMVKINADDEIEVVIGGSKAYRRQDVPEVFDITGSIYVTSPDYIRNCERLVDGRLGYIVIPEERSVDIDTEYDLYIADLMLRYPFEKV